MLEYKQAFEKYFDEHMDEILASLSEIISIDSVATLESEVKPFGEGSAKALKWGEDFLKSLGMKTLNVDGYAVHGDYAEGEPVLAVLSHLDTVPAGEDQKPMLEITRELVRRFNSTYGEVLVEPDIMLPENETARRLPGTDGKEKMSKSLGNCIYLSDDADTVWQKVRSMFTDPNHLNVSDPGTVEGNAVFTYLDAFSKDEHFAKYLPEYQNLDEMKDHYRRGGLGDMKCKKLLNSILNEMLEPIRQRRHELQQDIPEIYNILRRGTEKARETAAKTMDEVRNAMKINYFEDKELINQQAEYFKNIQ